MRHLLLLLFFSGFHFYSIGQTIVFDSTDADFQINGRTTVFIRFTIQGLTNGQNASITLSLPTSNELVLNTHYRVPGGVNRTVSFFSNRDSFLLDVYMHPSKKVASLRLPITLTIPGISPVTSFWDVRFHYQKGASASALTPGPAPTGNFVGGVIPAIAAVEKEYSCLDSGNKNAQMVQPLTFKKSLQPIYSKVILNNEGLVKNGTAANLTISDGVSLSALYQKSLGSSSFYKVGFGTKVKNNVNELFRQNSFRNDFTLSGGLTWVVGNPGRFFNVSDCQKLEKERKIQELVLKNDFTEYSRVDLATLTASVTQAKSDMEAAASLSRQDFNRGKSKYDSLNKLKSDFEKLQGDINKKGFESIVRDSLSAWEMRRAVSWTGYQVSWWDLDVAMPFTGYYLFDANRKEDSARYTLMGSLNTNLLFNHAHYGGRLLWYFSGGLSVNLDRGILAIPASDTLSIKSGDKTNLHYRVTDKDWYRLYIPGIGPSLNGLMFFGKGKVFGLEGGISFRTLFYNKVQDSKQNIWNARLGVLFSLNGEDQLGKGTFGILAQLVDYRKSMGSLRDNISVGVRVGIPFNRIFKAS